MSGDAPITTEALRAVPPLICSTCDGLGHDQDGVVCPPCNGAGLLRPIDAADLAAASRADLTPVERRMVAAEKMAETLRRVRIVLKVSGWQQRNGAGQLPVEAVDAALAEWSDACAKR